MQTLHHARQAVERAERQLAKLKVAPLLGPDFFDQLPNTLDAMSEITRQVDTAAKVERQRGRQAPAFWTWWDGLPMPLKSYRDDTLKGRKVRPGWVSRYRDVVTVPVAGGGAFVMTGMSFGMAPLAEGEDPGPPATEDEALDSGDWVFPNEILQLPDGATVERLFRGGSWDGEPVVEKLAEWLAHLRDDVLPEAERLLGEDQ